MRELSVVVVMVMLCFALTDAAAKLLLTDGGGYPLDARCPRCSTRVSFQEPSRQARCHRCADFVEPVYGCIHDDEEYSRDRSFPAVLARSW